MGFEIGRMFAPVEVMQAGGLDEWRKRTGEGNYRLVDVRQPAEYERGHIPGAVLIPLAELPARAGELSPGIPVVVYCAVGGRSQAAARYLSGRGFARVINLKGGIKAYRGVTLAGPPDAGLRLLEAVDGTADVLNMALGMETALKELYLSLAGEAAGETGSLLERLAAMEDGHIAKLSAWMRKEGREPGSPLENVASADEARKNPAKKRSLHGVNEHFEPDFDAESSSAVVFQGAAEGGNLAAGPGEGGAPAADIAAGLRPLLADPAALIDAAMGIELTALDLYVRMAAQSPSGIASLFFRLAEEERGHMEILARMRGVMTESS